MSRKESLALPGMAEKGLEMVHGHFHSKAFAGLSHRHCNLYLCLQPPGVSWAWISSDPLKLQLGTVSLQSLSLTTTQSGPKLLSHHLSPLTQCLDSSAVSSAAMVIQSPWSLIMDRNLQLLHSPHSSKKEGLLMSAPLCTTHLPTVQ